MNKTTAISPPPPAWKMMSVIFLIISLVILPTLLFMRNPHFMNISTQLFSFFSILFLLNFAVPDNHFHKHNSWGIYGWILLTELFIFLLCQNFSVFAFNLSGQAHNHTMALPHWPVWLGIWAYFSTTLALQHFAYYQLRQASFAAGLVFLFKNTYFDIVLKRALGIFNLGVHFVAVHLLIISVIFIIIEYFQPDILQCFHFASILFWMAFVFLNLLIHTPRIKQLLNRANCSNLSYLVIAAITCITAIKMSALLSSHLPNSNIFTPQASSYNPINATAFLFATLFILVTPLFASFIVKHSSSISRRKLLFISFSLPNLFYLLLSNEHFFALEKTLNNKVVFVIMVIVFLTLFFRSKNTQDFMTGALPLPKQRILLPAQSYVLFSADCLVLFNFYLLAIIIGPVSLYALTVTTSLLSAILGIIGIGSYFGKSYRLKRCSIPLPPLSK